MQFQENRGIKLQELFDFRARDLFKAQLKL